MLRVYLDHNVIDNIGKGRLTLPVDPAVQWIYSDEHFSEIERSGDTRFLDVLKDLKAKKLELERDQLFQITGGAKIHQDSDPHLLYSIWQEARGQVPISERLFTPILSRLYGADNEDQISILPGELREEVTSLLSSAGLMDDSWGSAVSELEESLREMVEDHFADLPSLEEQRVHFGTHGGRGGNLIQRDNPLKELWESLCKTWPEMAEWVTADQLFGFAPVGDIDDPERPIYLGIVACYTFLNIVGMRPDEKLSRTERMSAIMSDASHVGHAAYCRGLISGDQRLCDKANVIYRYKHIGCEALIIKPKGAC